jgi:Glycosyltransferase family 87
VTGPRAGREPAWLLAWATVVALAVVAVRLTTFKLDRQPLFVDFLTMWTGGRMARVDLPRLYDFAAIDRAQAWLLGAAARDRPFPYPPSALLVFEPLGRLPFWAAAWIWISLTVAAFAFVALKLLPRRRGLGACLIAFSPGVVWAAISGQCAFLLAALAIAGWRSLDDGRCSPAPFWARPRLSSPRC